MKMQWVIIIVIVTFMFVIGFAIGFFRGESVYLWFFRFLPDDVSFFDVLVGIATVIVGITTAVIAGIAIWQTENTSFSRTFTQEKIFDAAYNGYCRLGSAFWSSFIGQS